MIFELVEDVATALKLMPREHSRHRVLELLDEAIRRDVHFIDRHRTDYPQALFQCLWNTSCRTDVTDPRRSESERGPVTGSTESDLSDYLTRWRQTREGVDGFPWLRSQRPPALPLGEGLLLTISPRNHVPDLIAYSGNGRRLVSVQRDGTACHWDLESGKEEWRVRIPLTGAEVLAISGDGTRMATALGAAVTVYDTSSAAKIGELEVSPLQWKAVALSCDGRTVIAAGHDEGESKSLNDAVFTWDVSRNSCSSRFSVTSVSSLALSGDATRVICGQSNGSTVWNASTGDRICRNRGAAYGVTSVAWMPDDRHGCSCGRDGTVRVWNAATGRDVRCLLGHEHFVTQASSTPRGDRLISISRTIDASIRIWESESGRQLNKIRLAEFPTCLAVDPEGGSFACAFEDGVIRIWSIDAACVGMSPPGHRTPIRSVALCPFGEMAATTANDDAEIYVWNVKHGGPPKALFGHGPQGTIRAAFFPDGRRIASFGGNDGIVRVWDAWTGRPLAVAPVQPRFSVDRTRMSQDGIWIQLEGQGGSFIVDSFSGELFLAPVEPSESFPAWNDDPRRRHRVVVDRNETVVERVADKQVLGILPSDPDHLVGNVTEMSWAGAVNCHPLFFTLEGIQDVGPRHPIRMPGLSLERLYAPDVLRRASIAAGPFPSLLGQLVCPDSTIRGMAAIALTGANLSLAEKEQLCPLFVPLLAARAIDGGPPPELYLIASFARDALPHLQQGLFHVNPQVRLQIAHVISGAGQWARTALPSLIRAVREVGERIVTAGATQSDVSDLTRPLYEQLICTICYLGLGTDTPLDDLIALIEAGNERLQSEAVDALYDLFVDSPDGLAAHRVALNDLLRRDISLKTRRTLTEILARSPDAGESIADWKRSLCSDDPAVRSNAARSLHQACPDQAEVYQLIFDLHVKDDSFRTMAVHILKSLGPTAVDALFELAWVAVETPSDTLRRVALEAIAAISTRPGDNTEFLETMIREHPELLRRFKGVLNAFETGVKRGGLPRPNDDADPDHALILNRQWGDAYRRWQKLPWWKRWFTKPPERPKGI